MATYAVALGMGEAVGLGGGAVWIRKTHNHRSSKGAWGGGGGEGGGGGGQDVGRVDRQGARAESFRQRWRKKAIIDHALHGVGRQYWINKKEES